MAAFNDSLPGIQPSSPETLPTFIENFMRNIPDETVNQKTIILRGILDSHHDFFKFKKSIDIDSYRRGDDPNISYFERYHFTSLLDSYTKNLTPDQINYIIQNFRLHRSKTGQTMYTGGISSLEDEFVTICEKEKRYDFPEDEISTIDDLYAKFDNPNMLKVMVDTSKRVLKLPTGGSGRKLYYVLNAAIVNDPAPKLKQTKIESKSKLGQLDFEDHSGEMYEINDIAGPYSRVVLNPLQNDVINGKTYISTKVSLNDTTQVNVTMNRGSKHANCISLLTKRMENARKEINLNDFVIANDRSIDRTKLVNLDYAGLLTRKRFGDELQAEVCRRLNSQTEANEKYVIVTIDRMLYVHCLLIGCPCILDMGRGKNYKIYKGINTPYQKVNLIKGLRGGAAYLNEPAEDREMHDESSDENLNLEFILSDPFSSMLCYKTLKPGLHFSKRIDMNNLNSHALSEKPLPSHIVIPKDHAFEPWKNDYFLSKDNEVNNTYGATYSEALYHPYVSEDSKFKFGNNQTSFIQRYSNGQYKSIDVYNSNIIDSLNEEKQQILIQRIEDRLFQGIGDDIDSNQTGGAPFTNKVKDLLEYVLCILHIYELNSISDHEIHAIDYFDNRDSFHLISDKLELRIFLKLLLDEKTIDVNIPYGSNIVYFFIDMLRLINNKTSNIILSDLLSHIDYVEDCGIKMKVCNYNFEVTPDPRLLQSGVFLQLRSMINETSRLVKSRECQELIQNPHHSDNEKFINVYKLSFGAYSGLYEDAKMPLPIKRRAIGQLGENRSIMKPRRMELTVAGGKKVTKKKGNSKKPKPQASRRKGNRFNKKNKTINKKKTKSRTKNKKK